MPSLEIALATHNSARYLPELLQSLFCQTYQEFTILVSDDGSTDTTLNILSDFQKQYPGRIRVIEFAARAGGARANFARLAEQLAADYAMFCDHDDIWLPNKVALSIEHIRAQEARYGSAVPLLFHTDLIVVGPALEVLHRSYWSYTNIDPARNALRHLFMQNTAMGCAAIMNRALYERARPIPPGAIMHDCWISLVAAAFGKIEFVDQSTILYRLHGGNYAGARKWNTWHILKRAFATLGGANAKFIVAITDQAAAFLGRFANEITPEQRKAAAALAHFWSVGRVSRCWNLLRQGLLMHGLSRNVGLFVMAAARGVDDSTGRNPPR